MLSMILGILDLSTIEENIIFQKLLDLSTKNHMFHYANLKNQVSLQSNGSIIAPW